MAPSFHSEVQSTVIRVNWTPDEPAPKPGKTQQSAGKVMASVFWNAHAIIFIDYLEKGRTNSDYYIAFIGPFERRNRRKTAEFEEKESAGSPRQCTVSQVSEDDGKNPLIGLRISSSSTVFSRSAPSDYFLFSDLKRMLAGKKFSSNEEVIA
ncbi:uncharacterized protein LOC143199024 [Rhynchophorus ferrugineus]|uniref:uncharacterized protein LOC143199024 n=1 Tax=Rhynchophorus ferrugineus TaxID=354439 RepID=UPI003FCC2F32